MPPQRRLPPHCQKMPGLRVTLNSGDSRTLPNRDLFHPDRLEKLGKSLSNFRFPDGQAATSLSYVRYSTRRFSWIDSGLRSPVVRGASCRRVAPFPGGLSNASCRWLGAAPSRCPGFTGIRWVRWVSSGLRSSGGLALRPRSKGTSAPAPWVRPDHNERERRSGGRRGGGADGAVRSWAVRPAQGG